MGCIPIFAQFLTQFLFNNEGTEVQHKAGVHTRNCSCNSKVNSKIKILGISGHFLYYTLLKPVWYNFY